MVLRGKDAEAIAIFRQGVARHPDIADGYLMLGGAHETLGKKILVGDAPGGRPAATKHLESAAGHFTHVIELKGADAEFMHYQVLADVYSVVGLNWPEEHERTVRATVKQFPAEPMAHLYLITLVATRKEPLEPALHAARASIPPGAEARASLAASIAYWVRDFGRRYGDSATAPLLREALSLVNEAIKLDPAHGNAARTKTLIEKLQAGRQVASRVASRV